MLAAMLAGVVGYRFIHAAHAAPPRPTEIARPAVPAALRPAPIPTAVFSKDTTVPPPPPAGAQAHRNRPAAPRPTPVPMVEAAVLPVEHLVEPEEKSVAPIAPIKEERTDVVPDVVQPQSTPPADRPEDAKPQPRGKRVLKAVGHFLHIGGKKDADSPAPRQ